MMKKKVMVISSVLLCALLGGCISQVESGANKELEIREGVTATYRGGIVVDGVFDEWEDVKWRWVDRESGVLDIGTKPLAEHGKDLWFGFALQCDDDALYVAVLCYDDALSTDSCEPGSVTGPTWADDTLELFIDGDHNKAIDSRSKERDELRYGGEFALVANGAACSDYSGYPKTFGLDGYWSGATKVMGNDMDGYLVRYEVRLPWSVMGGEVGPNSMIGFNISLQDDDDGKGRESALYWKGSEKWPFRNESKFGDVYLQPKPSECSVLGNCK
ncbi:hypothetical protein JD969_12545 [Planctomycetota bacterium]|nr:hypothetical protein JD969_12545 [Planctomycetota bacterium]